MIGMMWRIVGGSVWHDILDWLIREGRHMEDNYLRRDLLKGKTYDASSRTMDQYRYFSWKVLNRCLLEPVTEEKERMD